MLSKKGSLSLEAILVSVIMLPIFLSLLVGSSIFYGAQSKNINLNFDTGRYVSTTGCEFTKLNESIPHLSKFDGYSVYVNDQKIQDGTAGEIIIQCPNEADKGDEFQVQTTIDAFQNTFYQFFPLKNVKQGIYVQEAIK